MNRRSALVLWGGAVWLGCAACAPVVRGGFTTSSDATVPGDVVESYDPEPCQDGSGAPFDWRTRLFVVRGPGGSSQLVEARSQYDELVYAHPFEQGDQLVYQVAVRSRGEPARLHEVRIGISGSEGGSYQVSLLRAGTGREEKFRGVAGTVLVTCRLERVSAPQPVDKEPAASKLPPS